MIRSTRCLVLISFLLLSACHHVGVRAGFSSGYLGGYYDTTPYGYDYFGPTIIRPAPHLPMGRPLPRHKPFHHPVRPYRYNKSPSFSPYRPNRPGAYRPYRQNRPGAFRPDRQNRPGAFRPDRRR